ncbi:MAG: TetR family transcriptional regulator [Lachnospiraceae bacterium]|nr:TetR family transcriptional regulator [Lachnospiraceae bacterium]
MGAKSENTCQALAASLKELMKSRPFEKITIKEITDGAGLIRPTFYNHFQDKYDLLEWIFCNEVILPAKALLDHDMLQEAAQLMLLEIEKEEAFYRKAIRIGGQNSFLQIVENVFRELLLRVIERHTHVSTIGGKLLTVQNIAEFFAASSLFVIVKWLESDEKVPTEEVAKVYKVLITRAFSEMMELGKEIG